MLDILTGRAEASPFRTIVLDVRLPRVLLGIVVGAGLAVIGTVLQALVRNQLADPFLLGVSSGASTGAVLVIVLGIGATLATTVTIPAAAFVGALLSLLLVYTLARGGGGLTTNRLVLAGVAVSYILSALTSLILVTSARADHLQEVLDLSLGGLGAARWDMLALPTITLVAGTAVLLTLARPLTCSWLLGVRDPPGHDAVQGLGEDRVLLEVRPWTPRAGRVRCATRRCRGAVRPGRCGVSRRSG
ncbi:Vitamin B12 import system permease protein BtuC [Streptomyces microflavus]